MIRRRLRLRRSSTRNCWTENRLAPPSGMPGRRLACDTRNTTPGVPTYSSGHTNPVSYREYLFEFRNIRKDADKKGPAAHNRLLALLRKLTGSMNDTWRDGEMLTAIAEAYAGINEPDIAISRYQEAVQLLQAQAPLKAVEQLANLMSHAAIRAFRRELDGRSEGNGQRPMNFCCRLLSSACSSRASRPCGSQLERADWPIT